MFRSQSKVGLGVLLAAAILAVAFGPAILRAWMSTRWPSVQGVIDSVRMEESSAGGGFGDPSVPDYRVFLRYHYFADGRRYAGTRFSSTGEFYSGDKSIARGFELAYPPGRTVDVFFSPKDPSDALLHPGLDYRHWFLLGIILVVLFLGIGIALGIVRVSIKQKKGSELINKSF